MSPPSQHSRSGGEIIKKICEWMKAHTGAAETLREQRQGGGRPPRTGGGGAGVPGREQGEDKGPEAGAKELA